MQVSIRSLLGMCAVVAMGVAAITGGGIAASVFHALVAVISIFAVITAFVGVQRPRAIAIGFSIPLVMYLVALISLGESEFNPHMGKLLTTRIAKYGYDALYTPIYTDLQTGKVVADYTPPGPIGFGGGAMPTVAMTDEFPVRSVYMATAHSVAILMFGLLGAGYAGWLYNAQRRQNNTDRRSVTQAGKE